MGPVNPSVTAPPPNYFHKLAIPHEGRDLIKILVEETNRCANQIFHILSTTLSHFQEL